jgi:NitT/TauT family transport system ATP-binding protein
VPAIIRIMDTKSGPAAAPGEGAEPGRAAPAKIAVEHVSKRYPHRGRASKGGEGVMALEDVNLAVRDGEFMCLLGPSGCGKTTLLKCVDGLVTIDRGRILVCGVPVTGPGRDRAFVFQNFGLFPWRTVQENVELPLEAAGMGRSQRREVARRWIETVGLGAFAHHHPHQLSGGMQQRVGIARALSLDPEILLMDEPFGALDAQTRELMQVELLQIWERTAKTVLFVTHSVDEAIFLAGRIAVLSAHPGTVTRILDVPIPYLREENQVRRHPAFADLRDELWGLLRAGSRPITPA